VAQGVVDEGEGLVLRERDEPQRQAREADGEGVFVDAVEASLRDEAARVQHHVAVRARHEVEAPLARPRGHHHVGEEAARLHEEGPAPHGGVAHLEVEQALRRGRVAHRREQRFERASHDGGGERRGRVVRARAPPLAAGLDHELPRAACRAPLHAQPVERREHLGLGGGGLEGVGTLRHGALREGGGVGHPGGALGGRLREHSDGGHPHLRALEAHRGAREPHDVVAHEGLVHGANLLDVEGPVRQPLPLEDQQPFEHTKHGLVVDGGHAHAGHRVVVDEGRSARGPPAFEEGEAVRVEELAAPRGHHEVAVRSPRNTARNSATSRGHAPKRRAMESGHSPWSRWSCSKSPRAERCSA
jgi:hypothetical protein